MGEAYQLRYRVREWPLATTTVVSVHSAARVENALRNLRLSAVRYRVGSNPRVYGDCADPASLSRAWQESFICWISEFRNKCFVQPERIRRLRRLAVFA